LRGLNLQVHKLNPVAHALLRAAFTLV
jgi:hypothetical protein